MHRSPLTAPATPDLVALLLEDVFEIDLPDGQDLYDLLVAEPTILKKPSIVYDY